MRFFSCSEGVIMFSVNEKVVYPGHGVARINRIVTKPVSGNETNFFELKFLHKDMTVLIPMHNLSAVGIRRLSSIEYVDGLLKNLAEPASKTALDAIGVNWNRRNKRYQEDIRQGNLEALCKIYRDLLHVAQVKELSFGEKMLLQQIEAMIAQEISLVRNVEENKAIEQLRSIVTTGVRRFGGQPVVTRLT
jgi:CarD family transcriptional regulator